MPPSEFVEHFTKPLAFSRPSSPASLRPIHPSGNASETHAKQVLRALILSLASQSRFTEPLINDTITALSKLEQNTQNLTSDVEEEALKRAVLNRLIVGLYSEALDTYITQATDVEAEAEWWADIESSSKNTALFLLQTAPSRLLNVVNMILHTVHTRNIPLTISVLTPSSLRRLFPSTDSLRPNALVAAIFPHLHYQTFSVSSPAFNFSINGKDTATDNATGTMSRYLYLIKSLATMPFDLTRRECRFKRKELEKMRDQRAEVLGSLAQMRGILVSALDSQSGKLESLSQMLNSIVSGGTYIEGNQQAKQEMSDFDVTEVLSRISMRTLPSQKTSHLLEAQSLSRPSRLTLLWPKLLFLPPLCIYAVRYVYTSRAGLSELAIETKETVEGFFKSWLLEPLKEVLKSVRAGGDDGVIVRKEGVAADFDSLERMTLSLARDELHYGPEQLNALSQKIRLGDLTPILQLYEEDIRRPLKSALTGTLLRSVFIQVQKAKVDIDQALTGIDKLLKSQELTFAFVGVAPALAIVYLVGGSLIQLWSGGRGRGRYGGKHRRAGAWFAMRRIERLLITQPASFSNTDNSTSKTVPIAPLTSGLLLLSVARLRKYAEICLPVGSRLREGFLQDVEDLEDPELGREEKMRVIERMWRSWGEILGWGRVGGEGVSVR